MSVVLKIIKIVKIAVKVKQNNEEIKDCINH